MSTANTFNILVSTLRPEKLIRGIYIGKKAKKTDFIHRWHEIVYRKALDEIC